jgi:ArsR family transcriptional regulator, arsenate/arsenite/antimonite-responsive transcriptional repressor
MAAVERPIACCAPLAAPVLDEQEAAATAELFKALADPACVRVVNVLATTGEPVCVCELIEPLGLAQPTVSHHLKKLTEAGLLEREQRGKWAYFSLMRDAVEKLAAVADLAESFVEAFYDRSSGVSCRRRRRSRRWAAGIRPRSRRCAKGRLCSTSAPAAGST